MHKKLLTIVVVILVAMLAAIPVLADPPASSGLNVVRYNGIVYLHAVDYKNGLSTVVGADIVEFCNGNFAFDLVSIQDIYVPEDVNRIIEIAHGKEVTTSVWPFTDFDCGLFTSIEPIATGKTNTVATDNDLFAYAYPDNVNWNAFGFSAQGLLSAPDGSTPRMNAAFRCAWDGVDSGSGMCTGNIILK